MLEKIFPGNWFRKPHPLIRANKVFFDDFDQSKPLSEYSFVVFDTELTGLNRKKDEIVSIGGVRITNMQIDLGQTFNQYIRPRKKKYTDATLIHRITPEQLEKAATLEEVLPEFIRFVENSLLVGHHVGLDMNFINRATKEIFDGTLSNPGIDTMKMAQGYKRVLLGYYHDHSAASHKYNLRDLSKEFGLPIFDVDDAFADAMQTAYLFLFLIKKFRKGGLETLKDLYQAGRSGSLVR